MRIHVKEVETSRSAKLHDVLMLYDKGKAILLSETKLAFFSE